MIVRLLRHLESMCRGSGIDRFNAFEREQFRWSKTPPGGRH